MPTEPAPPQRKTEMLTTVASVGRSVSHINQVSIMLAFVGIFLLAVVVMTLLGVTSPWPRDRP